jgi:hypothetical protein
METRNEKQVAIKKAAPLPSSILFESDAHAGFENVKNTITEWISRRTEAKSSLCRRC